MGFVESFDLNGVHVTTTVTNEQKKVDEILYVYCILSHLHKVKVIGFDTEWALFKNPVSKHYETKCATLHLCVGTSCLIIQLQHLDSIPNSLLNFLRLPDYTFVGIGIKESLAKLGKEFGFGCRNAVELKQWAAAVKYKPHLNFLGDVDELAHAVGLSSKLDFRANRPLNAVLNNWGQVNLSIEQAKLATINVYSYYRIGCSLLP